MLCISSLKNNCDFHGQVWTFYGQVSRSSENVNHRTDTLTDIAVEFDGVVSWITSSCAALDCAGQIRSTQKCGCRAVLPGIEEVQNARPRYPTGI